MLKWGLRILGGIVAIVALIYGVGLLLPRGHVATGDAVIGARPREVGALVHNVEDQARWRSGVSRIEVLERGPGVVRYREHAGGDVITYVFRQEGEGRYHSTIADPHLPFGGTWTIQVRPAPAGSHVSIREDGVVKDPFYRFFSRFVFGHAATIKAYLRDLEAAAEA